MEVYKNLEGNLRALDRVSPDFSKWLRGNGHKWYELNDRVLFNNMGWLDLNLDEESTLLGTMPPRGFYVSWRPQYKGAQGASIIGGCNLGYGLNSLLAVTEPGHKIGIYDPRPEMVALCLGITDYRDLILSQRVIFIPPRKDSLEDLLATHFNLQFYHGHVYYWADMPSMQLGPEYESWNKKCRDVLQKYKVQSSTLRKKQDVVVGNELENYKSAFGHGVLNDVGGNLRGDSAVVFGAGPSLEDFGPQLASLAVNALYVAGLQTLPALATIGIKPHLCMAIDFTRNLLKPIQQLEETWLKDIPLVYSTKVHPEVVRSYPGPKLALWTRGGLGTLVFKQRGHLLDTGGSVNVALVRLLAEMGISRISLAGMDFGWKGDFSHAQGHHAAEKKKNNSSGKFELRYNSDNQPVYSALPYLASLWELEKTISERNLEIYNLFGGCMDISGTERVDLKEMYKIFGTNDSDYGQKISRIIKYVREDTSLPVFEKRGREWSISLRRVIKRLRSLFSKPEKNRDSIRNTLQQLRFFVSQDPLYLTYLQPEVMDIAALEQFNSTYGAEDLVRVKHLCKKVLKKVRHVDQAVGGSKVQSAA